MLYDRDGLQLDSFNYVTYKQLELVHNDEQQHLVLSNPFYKQSNMFPRFEEGSGGRRTQTKWELFLLYDLESKQLCIIATNIMTNMSLQPSAEKVCVMIRK